VLAPGTGGTLRFLQMATQTVDRTVELPRPFDTTARGTLLP
jgi:hypothetical protein